MAPKRIIVGIAGVLLFAGMTLAATGRRPVDVARGYVEQNPSVLGVTAADVEDAVVLSVTESRASGVTHVYLQQRYRGIEVYNGIANVSVGRNGAVIFAGSRFIAELGARAGAQEARLSPVQAAGAAARGLGLRPSEPFRVVERAMDAGRATTLSTGGVAARPIEARLVWLDADGPVRLAWRLEIEELSGEHWWYALIDARTGTLLRQDDLVVQDSVAATAAAIARPAELATPDGPFPPTDGASYNVFPQPLESPNDGARELVTDVANPAASPFGWHDTDGAAGAEFTVTRGNNVHAYTDLDANNVPDPGSDPDGGPALLFDFPLDLTLGPETYRPAAVTNLFYWNNVMHDVTFNYGFDPASGNFQVNTYGGGGAGNDDVRAEAQDGSGLNNANFGTPPDGSRPRMQMFVWTHPFPNFVTVDSPPAIADDYSASGALFGPTLVMTGPIPGDVVPVDDGVGTTSDGCEPLVGFPAGAIALIDRGGCTFVLKVQNAQAAAAIGVIVANNVPGNPITMGGTDPAAAIPAVMVSLDDGNLFKANLPVHATLRANPLTSVNRDSDLDAGVICHEYGHGISNRLTGGPAVVNCLNNAEQMGEGWSDWFALTLTTDPSDTATTSRGIGTYVVFEPDTGLGIRPTPYSTDMTVNPSTYASVADPSISQPHGIGYVWNTMLWEVYWNLVDRYGYNADVYDAWSSGGNNLAFQLVMDGMKLQVCRPGFVDGRDAILAADAALTGGANQCEIWRGFAKRGLGASADQGSSLNRFDGVEAFDLPASCLLATFGGFQPPVYGPPVLNYVNAGSTVPLKFDLEGVASAPIDSQEVDCSTLVPTGEAPLPIASPAFPQKGTQYHVNWKTDGAWEGTCRRVTVRIPAASDAWAYFDFH
ncbi:MAG TPA: M36 family metallopeptidase [Thermoanaerobaculia bacterium]|nr:M36 family metallopeptidase [Thermoanaerobaculia bacterium]